MLHRALALGPGCTAVHSSHYVMALPPGVIYIQCTWGAWLHTFIGDSVTVIIFLFNTAATGASAFTRLTEIGCSCFAMCTVDVTTLCPLARTYMYMYIVMLLTVVVVCRLTDFFFTVRTGCSLPLTRFSCSTHYYVCC